MAKAIGPGSQAAWFVVAAVGLLVIVLVFALGLFKRLDAADQVLDGARPAFTEERVQGDIAGISIVSSITDLAEPIATDRSGTAAAEVPKLVAFVSEQTGLPQAQVLALLEQNFPHTTALLQAIPLSAVTTEIPKLIAFLSQTLGITEEQVLAAIQQNFPGLAQSITALPAVTDGWHNVPGTENLTRFNGDQVTDVPDVRDYLSEDLIPAVARQQDNFQKLDDLPGGPTAIPPLLLVLGVGVLGFGLWMARPAQADARRRPIAWIVVVAAGLIVVVLVAGVIQAFSRLNAGQDLIDDLQPAFTQERVEGARAGINIVSSITDLVDPIATESGTAAAEVPKLVAFVSEQTGLPQAQVLALLEQNFPHTTALLQAIPLSDVNAEVPKLIAFLSQTLGISQEQVLAAIQQNFPGLAQSITALPAVTDGWDQVPGTEDLTRFNGDQVTDVPDVRNYFSEDVVPVLESQQGNFEDTADPFPDLDVFPPLLLGVGILVILYGSIMAVWAARELRSAGPPSGGGPSGEGHNGDGPKKAGPNRRKVAEKATA
ncbi:MAG: hypothetical protein ACRDK5_10980 [Solirubrobacterales bacterium]